MNEEEEREESGSVRKRCVEGGEIGRVRDREEQR
jgi:hypothetical protein